MWIFLHPPLVAPAPEGLQLLDDLMRRPPMSFIFWPMVYMGGRPISAYPSQAHSTEYIIQESRINRGFLRQLSGNSWWICDHYQSYDSVNNLLCVIRLQSIVMRTGSGFFLLFIKFNYKTSLFCWFVNIVRWKIREIFRCSPGHGRLVWKVIYTEQILIHYSHQGLQFFELLFMKRIFRKHELIIFAAVLKVCIWNLFKLQITGEFKRDVV